MAFFPNRSSKSFCNTGSRNASGSDLVRCELSVLLTNLAATSLSVSARASVDSNCCCMLLARSTPEMEPTITTAKITYHRVSLACKFMAR